jgi:hypothetical protein
MYVLASVREYSGMDEKEYKRLKESSKIPNSRQENTKTNIISEHKSSVDFSFQNCLMHRSSFASRYFLQQLETQCIANV